LELFAYDGSLQLIDFEGGEDPALKSGDVVIFPISRRPANVSVLGGVATASAVPFRPGLTLREAIAGAGGLDIHADAKNIKVLRKGEVVVSVDYSSLDNPALQRGDTIQVPRIGDPHYVTISGQVLRPNLVGIREMTTLEDALKAAGGIVEPAAIDRIVVKRGGGVGGHIRIDLRKQPKFLVKSGDIIEVPSGVVGAKPDLGLPRTGFPIPP
jgi:protein involved in polysaccharide export with SLBB domain